jgi:GNAT superfamily N-acetyltransferase
MGVSARSEPDPICWGKAMAIMDATGLAVVTFAQRPDLLKKVFAPEIQCAVPEFMRHDPVAALYYSDGQLDCYREFGLVAIDSTQPDVPVARAFSVPFAFRDATGGREELPDGGWDAVIRWADEDRRAGRPATAVSALEIMVAPRLQRQGTSRLMLTALRSNAQRLGFADLYAPLRPTDKHREPLMPFSDYVAQRREDGLPHDSWVRTHIRAGARIVKIAPCSMVIAGTIAEWSRWTGIGFTASGPAIVPGALSPIHVSLEQDHAVYVEPNLWVHHRLV